MQIAPSELRGLSLWQFAAMTHGWNAANKPAGDSDPLKPQEEDELERFISQPSVWMN